MHTGLYIFTFLVMFPYMTIEFSINGYDKLCLFVFFLPISFYYSFGLNIFLIALEFVLIFTSFFSLLFSLYAANTKKTLFVFLSPTYLNLNDLNRSHNLCS